MDSLTNPSPQELDKDIDVVVGGELITCGPRMIGENSSHESKERAWLRGMDSAYNNRDRSVPQRLKNIREIAQESIRRKVLSLEQVQAKLKELGIIKVVDQQESSTKETQTSPESAKATKIRTIATALAEGVKNLSKDEIRQDSQIMNESVRLQFAINDYKQELISSGKTPAEVKTAIVQILDSTGLKYEQKSQELGAKIRGLRFSDLDGKWENAIGEIIEVSLNAREIIDAVREKLTVPESEVVFRMMSREELEKILQNGVIGGEVIPGQVESGVTWWGDKLGDSLNQRSGKIRTNANGGMWGGQHGIMIAVRRSAIEDAIIQKRHRNPLFPESDGYDAYLTQGKISADQITDVFKVGIGRGDEMGMIKVEKLVI